MTFSPNAATVWRDYNTDGVSASGVHSPLKSDIRSLGLQLETAIAAAITNECFVSAKHDYGAKGDGATPDDTAIQNAINYLSSNFGGGIVFFPPGTYVLTSGITVKTGVRLVGSGKNSTIISAFATNVRAVYFDSSCLRGCGLWELTVLGYYNANTSLVTTNAVESAAGVSVVTYGCKIWYGNAAMYTKGVDGMHFDTWFNGCVNSVVSDGANWYVRTMFNGNGSFGSYTYAFEQGTGYVGITSRENGFTDCDFSGNFTKALYINGTHATGLSTLTKLVGCVMGAPINIQLADWTCFSACEIGSADFTLNGTTGGYVSVVGCYGPSMTLTGNYSKAGNHPNIA